MKTVYKYGVGLQPTPQEVTLPEGARMLCVQMQHDTPQVWALVDPYANPVPCEFLWLGTGHPAPDNMERYSYVGTVQLRSGAFVFHLFWRPLR